VSVLIVGSVARDEVQVPWSSKTHAVLGGSATYAALAARLWGPASIVAVVGSDFPKSYRKLFDKKRIDVQGLMEAPGRTFYWKGRYNEDLQPKTLRLDLGVFSSFKPKLPPGLVRRTRVAFLGNIHPALQWEVFRQLKRPKLTACDSRDDWIRSDRKHFLALVKRMDILFLNDSEARLLTGDNNLVRSTRALARWGPKVAIIKKGEHGLLMATRQMFYALPAVPLHQVNDPTGAGDSFAGACLGYLNTQPRLTWDRLCRAVQYGSVVASMSIETYGPGRLIQATRGEIGRRMKRFRTLVGAIG